MNCPYPYISVNTILVLDLVREGGLCITSGDFSHCLPVGGACALRLPYCLPYQEDVRLEIDR